MWVVQGGGEPLAAPFVARHRILVGYIGQLIMSFKDSDSKEVGISMERKGTRHTK